MSSASSAERGERAGDAGAWLELPSFIVFSDDWGEHPSSSQHLFRYIAERHAVLWVNTIGMRRPRLSASDFRKALRKVSRMALGTAQSAGATVTPARLSVSQPKMLPFTQIGAVRRWNARSVIGEAQRQMRLRGLRRPIVVATVANACDYVDALQASRVVYYCVDDFGAWPGLDSELVRSMEDELLERADIIFAASPILQDRLARSGKPVHLLTHGVDVELFSRAAPAEHACLQGIAAPRAGFFGLFDERSDQQLLGGLAARMPDFSFVIAGPVTTDADALRACPNVHFTGPLAYRELPALIAGLQVLVIPYRADAFADTLAPLKLYEYLATGKPVVSTPIAAARALSDCIAVAASLPEWEAALRSALNVAAAPRREQMRTRLAEDSWAHRAETLLRLCATDNGRGG